MKEKDDVHETGTDGNTISPATICLKKMRVRVSSGSTKTEYFLTVEGNRALWRRQDLLLLQLTVYMVILWCCNNY
jgi:hypothetical protein